MSINDFKPNPDDITSIDGIDISEGCPPSNMNDAVRHVMSNLHDLVNKTDVTQSTSGWMSSADKIKLDSIEKATQLSMLQKITFIQYKHPLLEMQELLLNQLLLEPISLTGDVTGSTSFDGSGNVSLTTLDSKASLLSPALTGTPTAPTADVGTNTNQIATTEFVASTVNNVSLAVTKLESLPNTRAEILAKNTDFTVPSYGVFLYGTLIYS